MLAPACVRHQKVPDPSKLLYVMAEMSLKQKFVGLLKCREQHGHHCCWVDRRSFLEEHEPQSCGVVRFYFLLWILNILSV